MPENACYVPYAENVAVSTTIAVVSFWVPLFIIIALYIKIYRVAKRLSKRSERSTKLKMLRDTQTKQVHFREVPISPPAQRVAPKTADDIHLTNLGPSSKSTGAAKAVSALSGVANGLQTESPPANSGNQLQVQQESPKASCSE